jgi:hypothetical protein
VGAVSLCGSLRVPSTYTVCSILLQVSEQWLPFSALGHPPCSGFQHLGCYFIRHSGPGRETLYSF